MLQKDDEVVVLLEDDKKKEKSRGASDNDVQIVVETESSAPANDADDKENDPATPKTPGSHPKDTSPTKMASAKKTGREVDLDRKAWVRRKSKPQVDAVPPPAPAAELKQIGAPKKRVISDGHWRRDRTAAKEEVPTPEKEKDTTPKPVTIRRSVASVGLKVPPSMQEYVESDPEPESSRTRPGRHTRKVSNSKSAETPLDPDYESSGTKVYIKRRRRSRPEDDYRRSDSSYNAPPSTDKRSATTDIIVPSLSPPRPKSEPRQRKSQGRDYERPQTARQANEDDDAPRRPSSGHRKTETLTVEEDLQRQPSTAQGYAKRITERIRKSPSPAPVQVQPHVHATRIDGWLANMPDPFVELRKSSLTPEPLEISKKTSRNRSDVKADSRDSPGTGRSGDRKRSLRQELKDIDTRDFASRISTDDISEVSTSPSSTLKRRGAGRKSPTKDRFVRGTSPSTGEALMSGALPGSSPEPLRPTPPKSAERPRIPSGGKRLSTIVSVDSLQPRVKSERSRPSPLHFSDDQATSVDGSMLSRVSDGDSPRRTVADRDHRVTDHSDLMSVLSLSRDDAHVKPATRRSTRTRRAKVEPTTIGEIMNDFSAEELKYQRELRTLVDGVVPVLLQHALSSKNSEPSAPGSRVFSRPVNDPSVTQPIIDMGIALERLKTCHKRAPLHEPSELLTWAGSASKLYSEYLRCWRLGFTGIVVNLAPADDGLPRNEEGDLVDGAGERVDVAYLLKRPLVRLKYLAKAFKGINQLQPSANAEDMTARYQSLINDAKKRVNDEQARLEDEAASSIDATRARDPRSLAPITGVTIDPTRSVGARDYFDMDLLHSSGQQVGCKIEIIYRDDAPNRGKAGDVLFCEVSTTGRWLLFPPLPHSLVTARNGDRPGELVVMIRGFLANARQWREVMSLQAEDEQTCADWIDMLGSSPMPPRLSRKSSFNMLKDVGARSPAVGEPAQHSPSRDPSAREIEIPIGEPTKKATRTWDASEVNSVCNQSTNTDMQRAKASRYRSNTASSPSTPSIAEDPRRQRQGYSAEPEYFYDRHHGEETAKRPSTSHARSQSDWTTSSMTTDSRTDYSVWLPSEDQYSEGYTEDDGHSEAYHQQRPGMQRRTSSVPSSDLPTIPKIRKKMRPETPNSDRDALPSQKGKSDYHTEPSSAPAKMQERPMSRGTDSTIDQAIPAPRPSQRVRLASRPSVLQSFTPAFMKKDRRPSSPLKHEYAPSTASYSMSESEYSEDLADGESITSESTLEDELENMTNQEEISTVGDLKAFQDYTMRPLRTSSPPETQFTMAGASLGPSESASQGPYRSVPQTNVAPAQTIAGIFCWSDRGQWDSLHPDECRIFVTPGLIEAFDVTQASSVELSAEGEGSTPSSKGIRPLVALELTPLVPLRRGTAVDISVRSPPSANSLIRTSNNVMFRSRSPEDCERLYALINRARIENPTYVALQHARGPVQQSNWGEAMDRRNNTRQSSGSWWNLGSRKSVSYRSNGSRPASVAATESSVGTMNSAFSALRRLSGSNRIFNIAKSTITSRYGTQSTNSESLSSGVATPNPLDPRLGTPLGVTNSKIRLYIRENASKWKDLGSARLTVMLPPRQESPANPKHTGMEKRVLVYGKSKGELLLDVTLGETAFERVARTGIAVSVYEENMGPNGEVGRVGAVGGVLSARTTVYMVQMKSVSFWIYRLDDIEYFLLMMRTGTRSGVYLWFGRQVAILMSVLLHTAQSTEKRPHGVILSFD